MNWILSHRSDQTAREVADRHYNRQKPGTPQFVPPGRCCVLYANTAGKALWVTSWPYAEYVMHDWAGAWVNSLFRNEGAGLSSELILEAVSVTRWFYENTASWKCDPIPGAGMITFVDPAEVQSRNPGYCYECAGFTRIGKTKGGLITWQLLPDAMPAPTEPLGLHPELFEVAA